MTIDGNIHEIVLNNIPLVISGIYFLSRWADRRESGENVSTIDYIVNTILIVSMLYVLQMYLGLYGASDYLVLIVLCLFNIIEYVFTFYFLRYAMENVNVSKDHFDKVDKLSKYGMWFAILVILALVPGGYVFTVENGAFIRGNLYALIMLYPTACAAYGITYLVLNKDVNMRTRIAFFSYCIVEIACMGIQLRHKGLSLSTVSLALILMILYTNIYSQRGEELIRVEKALAEESIKRMQLQMRPHFMYNTLASIQELCYVSPKEAEAAIGDFTEYLRGNIDNMDKAELVPFTRELELTMHYINLEKVRFGDRVREEYNIEVHEFMIPSVTLQPLVENAIKYGICTRVEGGVLKISTSENDSEYRVCVEDDGPGFVSRAQDESRSHVGLTNVRSRLEAMCNGRLEIESEEGKGTRVTVVIPK